MLVSFPITDKKDKKAKKVREKEKAKAKIRS